MKKIIESHAQPMIEWFEGKDRYVEHIGKAIFDDGEVVYWVGSCLGGEPDDFRFENFADWFRRELKTKNAFQWVDGKDETYDTNRLLGQ